MEYLIFSTLATLATVFIFYSWFLFPIIIVLLSRFFPQRKNHFPDSTSKILFISVIISAYNEEKNIRKKINNLLEQDYPLQNLEIIVASDGSTDMTNEIVKEFENVKLLDFKSNRGKALINNDAAEEAKGDVLFFTDAETILANDFISKASKYFLDQNYGCGSGDYTFESDEVFGQSESIYWKIEKKIRNSEFKIDILPFASGGCMLIRKELYKNISSHSDIDNILPLHVISEGKKVFYSREAKAYDKSVTSEKSHFKKRVRTTQRSLLDIASFIPILFRKKYFTIVLILISHRVLRWFTGIFLIILLISTLMLNNLDFGPIYIWKIFLFLQILFYFFGFLGFLKERVNLRIFYFDKVSSFVYSFILANISFTIAIYKILLGYRIDSWKSI